MTAFFFDLIPASFPALALAHFLALLSPGPDFFIVVGQAIRYRLRGTVLICVGIALGNGVYIVLAIAGWSIIRQSPAVYRSLELAGAAYLIWMGYMLVRSGRRPASLTAGESSLLSFRGQLLAGLASALLNPKNALFYLTLMTTIIGPEATLGQQAFCGTWMVLLVLAWDIGLAAVVAYPGMQKALARRIPLIESVAGGFLVFLGGTLILAPIFPIV